MKGKQLIYIIISLVFFIATGVVVYVNLSGPKTSEETMPAAATGQTSAKSLLPYGTDLNFNVLQRYNGGQIQPFIYEQVTPEEIGVTDHDALIKPEAGL